MDKGEASTIHPWYKELWFWLLFLGPAIVIVAGIATFIIAQKTADSLVDDDYYKQGKEINLQLNRDRAAYTQHISADIMFSDNLSSIRVLTHNIPPEHSQLILRMLHPTKSELDQTILLQKVSDTLYQANVKPATSAHWYIRLEDKKKTWRIQGEWVPTDSYSVKLDSMLPGTD